MGFVIIPCLQSYMAQKYSSVSLETHLLVSVSECRVRHLSLLDADLHMHERTPAAQKPQSCTKPRQPLNYIRAKKLGDSKKGRRVGNVPVHNQYTFYQKRSIRSPYVDVRVSQTQIRGSKMVTQRNGRGTGIGW
jgi:hypothetical protein